MLHAFLVHEKYKKKNMNQNEISEEKEQQKLIGHLTKPQGIVGYSLAPVGHPVWEYMGRYFIEVYSNKDGSSHLIPYNKKSLSPVINFL